jgi:putative redox protein
LQATAVVHAVVTEEPGVAAPETAARRRRRVRGSWRGNCRVELDVRDGRFALVSDERLESGGEDAGPAPSELLFASVASCFAMAVVWTARKRRLTLPDLEVVVGWGYDRKERIYDDVTIEARSSLAAAMPEEYETLIRLAQEACWVTRTTRRGMPISVRAAARE